MTGLPLTWCITPGQRLDLVRSLLHNEEVPSSNTVASGALKRGCELDRHGFARDDKVNRSRLSTSNPQCDWEGCGKGLFAESA